MRGSRRIRSNLSESVERRAERAQMLASLGELSSARQALEAVTAFGQTEFGQTAFGQFCRWGPGGVGARRGGGPEGWGPNPEKVGPEGWGPEGWGPEGWGARHFALFLLSPTGNFILSSLSGGFLVEFWWCLKRRDAQMCAFGVLWLSCEAPAARRFKHHQNSTNRHPDRHKKERNGGGRGKKSAKFWAPHPWGPHRSGPHPSGPPPFGAPTIRGPTLRGSSLRGPFFLGWACTLRDHTLGGHPSGAQKGACSSMFCLFF